MSANSAASLRALYGVRLAMVSDAQLPFAATDRSRRARRRRRRGSARACPASAMPRLCSRSRIRPTPSVLSPSRVVSSKKAMVFTACARRRARRQLVDQLGGRLLVRQRDIETAHAAGQQAQSLAPEIVRVNVEQAIDQILRRRLGEHAVNERRPAVGDRVPDHAVLIGRPGLVRQIHGRKPLRRALREIGQNAVGSGALDGRRGTPSATARSSSQPFAAAAMIIEYSPLT